MSTQVVESFFISAVICKLIGKKVYAKDRNTNLLDSNWPSIFFPSAHVKMLAKTKSLEETLGWPLFLAIRHLMNVPGNTTQEGTCRTSSRQP